MCPMPIQGLKMRIRCWESTRHELINMVDKLQVKVFEQNALIKKQKKYLKMAEMMKKEGKRISSFMNCVTPSFKIWCKNATVSQTRTQRTLEIQIATLKTAEAKASEEAHVEVRGCCNVGSSIAGIGVRSTINLFGN